MVCKSELLPRHKLEDITIEMVKEFEIDADCYDTDDRSFHIETSKRFEHRRFVNCNLP